MERKETRGPSKDYILTPAELVRFEHAAKTVRERAYIRLAAWWGLRAGEIAHFSSAWLSAQEGQVRVPAMCRCDVCLSSGSPWRPKTANAARSLPVKTHEPSWIAIGRFVETYYEHGEAVVSRQRVWQVIRRVADRAAILHRVFPHALRATAATQIAASGWNEAELCASMGWSDLAVARSYVQASGVQLERAAKDRPIKWWA